MAIPVSIDALINRRVVESNRIEFKCDFNPDPMIRSICAFANDIDNMGGGYIIVGVEEENGAPKSPWQESPRISLTAFRRSCASIAMPLSRSLSAGGRTGSVSERVDLFLLSIMWAKINGFFIPGHKPYFTFFPSVIALIRRFFSMAGAGSV